MSNQPLLLAEVRYQRAFRFANTALHTLCCASGSMKERLQKIDLEFFTLTTNELPESEKLRAKFSKLHEVVTSKEVRYPNEGRISATLEQLHHTKLKFIAQLIWEIHVEFLTFMRKDDVPSY